MENLYRFISFENFVNLVVRKKERYVRPSTWDDTYEGYYLSKLGTEEGTKEVIELWYKKITDGKIETTLNNYLKLWYVKWFSYGQCWTETQEDDAMWRIYSYDKKSIRIESDKKKIKNIFENNILWENKQQFLKKIEYIKDDFDSNAQKDILDEMNAASSYFIKRDVFQHEKEYRNIVINNDVFNKLIPTENTFIIPPFLNKMESSKGDPVEEMVKFILEDRLSPTSLLEAPSTDKEIYAENIDIKNYIKSVLVNPFAEQWIVDLVEQICEENEILFKGRSEMYERINN